MDAINPKKDEGAGARDASPVKQDLRLSNFADVTDDGKICASIATNMALACFSQSRAADGKYTIACWNLVRKVGALDSIEQFLRQVAS